MIECKSCVFRLHPCGPTVGPMDERATGRWALAALALPMLMSSLGVGVANVALPTLEADLGASFAEVQWVALSYLLVVTALVVSAGRLGDLMGRRRLLLAGLGLFTTASASCAAAPTLALLIAARAAQGAGAAVLMALTLALVAEAVPAARSGRAMGLLGTTSAIGTALGPSLGGALIAALGWRAIFLVNVPIGLIAFALASRHLPRDRPPAAAAHPRSGLAGTALLAGTLAAYALAMTSEGVRVGWRGAALLVAAAVGAALFAATQARSATPLVRPGLLRDPVLRGGLVTSALVSTVMMTTLVVGPFHLSLALGLEPAAVGLALSAGPAAVIMAGVPAGRLADRVGPGRLTGARLGAMAAGAALLALTPIRLGVAGYVAPTVVLAIGYAVVQTANTTAVVMGSPPDGRGVISGLLSLSRNLGLVTGGAPMAAVFALGAGTARIAGAAPEAVAAGTHAAFAVAAALPLAALALTAADRRSASAAVSAER